MAMSTVQLEEARKAWAATTTTQIGTYGESQESLRLYIEAEKVSLLYEIAIQLADNLEHKRHLAAYPPRTK